MSTYWHGDALFILHVVAEIFLSEFFELCQIKAETQNRVTITSEDVKSFINMSKNV